MYSKDQDETLNFFSWKGHFDATVVVDDVVYPNRYNLEISFIPKSKEISQQNIGFDKIKYLVERLCENSVVFSPTNQYGLKCQLIKYYYPEHHMINYLL
jgi:hypothetical protein